MKTYPGCEHGGEIYRIARQLSLDPLDLLDFSSSINPLGPPAWVKDVLAQSATRIVAYPDNSSWNVRKAIAGYWRMDPESILVGNGSTELIFLAARAYKPRRTAIVGPTFGEYERAALSAGSQVAPISMDISNGFQWIADQTDWDTIARSNVCFVCNPNNPSGTVLRRDLLLEMVRRCPQTLFVIDEAFIDFMEDPASYTLLENCKTQRNLLVLRSFTKFYAIAGLRLGYAIADPSVIRTLEGHKEPWSVNVVAQAVGERLLQDQEYADRTRSWLPGQREWLMNELSNIPKLRCFRSQVNYVLLRIQDGDLDSHDLFELFIKQCIVIRDASSFRGLDRSFIRVAVKIRSQNIRLLEGLKKVLGVEVC